MTVRRVTWAWLALAAIAVTCALIVLTGYVVGDVPFFEHSLYIVSGLAPLAVGVVLVIHRPGNAVGRRLVLIGATWTLGEAARIHLWSGSHIGPLPGADLAAWILSWVFIPAWLLIPFVLAVFPSGRSETAWLRWPIRIGLVAAVVFSVISMVTPVSLATYGDYLEGMTNPWALEMLQPDGRLWDVLDPLIGVIFGGLALMILADLLARWRRSTGVERLQMRWFGFGVLTLVLLLGISAVSARVEPQGSALAEVATVVLAINAVPVAIGVAVSRFRLYEIDRLFSRTVSYALVVALLALVYAAIAVGLPRLLPQDLDSSWAVAAATLVTAGLFHPVRRRAKRLVDRRFNRVRYDAQQQMNRLAGRLRNELDLGEINAEIRNVVATTMQPTTASVWIRRTENELGAGGSRNDAGTVRR